MKRGGVAIVILAGLAAYAYSRTSAASIAPGSSSSGSGGAAGSSSAAGASGSNFSALLNLGFLASPSSAPVPAVSSSPAPGSGGTTTPASSGPGIFSSIGNFFGSLLGSGSSGPYTSTSQLNMSAYWKTGAYPEYAVQIANAEVQNGIPTDLWARELYQESGYRPSVIDCTVASPAGALGIAQFEPATAASLGITPCDPNSAIPGGAKYLASLYRQFGSWKLALMAYDWGEGNVSAWVAGGETGPVPQETQNYVAQITADVPVA